jgi:Protein of unknown function (DUF1214)
VAANLPAKQFWSVTVYDEKNRQMLVNKTERGRFNEKHPQTKPPRLRTRLRAGRNHRSRTGRPESLCRSVDHLRSLPVKNPGELPVIPVYERAAEVRAIKVG